MRVVLADVKRGFLSLKFLAGVVLLVIIGVIGAGEIMRYISTNISMFLDGDGYEQGIMILCQESLRSDLFLMGIPIVSSLAFGAAFSDELRSRFVLASLPRSGRKKYLFSKILVTGLTGGFMVLLSALLIPTPVCVYVYYGRIPILTILDMVWKIKGALLFPLTMSALDGVLWSLVGGLCAALMKNKYMAYITPFILYYILSEFQIRYYAKALVLNPKEWIKAAYLPVSLCVTLTLGMVIILSISYGFVMKRRLENV